VSTQGTGGTTVGTITLGALGAGTGRGAGCGAGRGAGRGGERVVGVAQAEESVDVALVEESPNVALPGLASFPGKEKYIFYFPVPVFNEYWSLSINYENDTLKPYIR
jgi:hypothetical protein